VMGVVVPWSCSSVQVGFVVEVLAADRGGGEPGL
jgi:hypothetical protein